MAEAIVDLCRGNRRTTLVLLNCYLDESSDGLNEVAFSIGAVIGTETKWDWLDKEWRAVLRKHGVAYFRNADCVGVDGAFKHFRANPSKATTEDRSKTLAIRKELMHLCINSRVVAYGVTIGWAEFRAVANTPEKLEAFGGTPHYHAFYNSIGQCARHVQENIEAGEIAFGFDEHQQNGAELQRVFKEAKERSATLAPILRNVASFDDKVCVPVQVADLFAAMIRRFGKSGDPPPEFAPLKDRGVIGEILFCDESNLRDHLKSRGLR